MPNKPKTTLRNVRVDDELWAAALETAAARGENVSEAIRRFLKRYVKNGSK
jgi:antitoxin component of RelBE/YafQ-DinJ toxin-antitoxin module